MPFSKPHVFDVTVDSVPHSLASGQPGNARRVGVVVSNRHFAGGSGCRGQGQDHLPSVNRLLYSLRLDIS